MFPRLVVFGCDHHSSMPIDPGGLQCYVLLSVRVSGKYYVALNVWAIAYAVALSSPVRCSLDPRLRGGSSIVRGPLLSQPGGHRTMSHDIGNLYGLWIESWQNTVEKGKRGKLQRQEGANVLRCVR